MKLVFHYSNIAMMHGPINIRLKMDFTERGWEGLVWIDLAQYLDRWLVVGVQYREFLGSVKFGNFLDVVRTNSYNWLCHIENQS